MKLPRQVYAIQHNITKRIYIGSSSTVKERYMNHIYRLRKGKHPISDMQKDFDEFGEDYSFFIIDEIKSLDECIKEYEWMNKYNSHVRGVGYNYMDKAINHIYGIADIPYKNGVPEYYADGKERLKEIIENLNEVQVFALLRFLKTFL